MSGPGMMGPPPYPDESMGPALLGVIWTMVAVDIIAVALRFFVRTKKRSLGADDWLMLVATVFFIATVAVVNVIVNYGLGRHMAYIPPTNFTPFLKWVFILQSFTFFTLAFAKMSIALLIMALMGPDRRWGKRLLWFNIVFFFILTILSTIFNLASCTPIQASWDHTVQGKCWPLSVNSNWAIAISTYSAFFDFLLAGIPISLMWSLQMDLKKKIIICILLGLGVFSGIAAIVKTAQSKTLEHRADFSWEAWSLYAWSTTEYFLNIFCGTVPTLKPLWDRIFKGKNLKQAHGGNRVVLFSMSNWSGRFGLHNVARLFSSRGSSRTSNSSRDNSQDSVKLTQPASTEIARSERSFGSHAPNRDFITIHETAADKV